jgi:DNA primase
MIPIRDIEGNIIGYGGRELPDEQPSIAKKPVAKYVNTPTTAGNTNFQTKLFLFFTHFLPFPVFLLVFKKKDTLFALDIASKTRQSHHGIILVEGYFDVIALYEIGIKNVVASMGTSLSLSQIFRAANHTSTGEIILLFDQDIPGQKAMERIDKLLDSLKNPVVRKKYDSLLHEYKHSGVVLKKGCLADAVNDIVVSNPDESAGVENKKIPKIKDCGDVVQSFPKEVAVKIIQRMISSVKILKTFSLENSTTVE